VETRFQPSSQAKPGRLAASKGLRRFPFLATTIGLAATLFLPGGIYAQGAASAQDDADLKKFQPLDLRPGCGQVCINTSQTGILEQASPETYRGSMPNATPAQIAKIVADVNAQVDKQEEASKKGTNKIQTACPLKREFEGEIISPMISLLGGGNCTRTLHSSGQELHLHLLCPAVSGTGQADFERIDPENFKGTTQIITRNRKTTTTTMTFVGKWVGDMGPHLPSAIATDANGRKPQGPGAVAQLDPLRIVATIDGKQITARQGMEMMKGHNDGSGLPELLQRLYMQRAIAEEAVKLQLDRQLPWKEKLQNTQMQIFQMHQNYAGDPNIPPELMARWQHARGHILWNAYFSQAETDEQGQTLLKQKMDKYKIQGRDPDFFVGR
jgi:hypothetical protein